MCLSWYISMLLLRRDYYYQCLTYCGTFESSAMINWNSILEVLEGRLNIEANNICTT